MTARNYVWGRQQNEVIKISQMYEKKQKTKNENFWWGDYLDRKKLFGYVLILTLYLSFFLIWQWSRRKEPNVWKMTKSGRWEILMGELSRSKKIVRVCFNSNAISASFPDLARGCQTIRNKMSGYSEQGVRLSKRMSVYQYPWNISKSCQTSIIS